MLVRPVRIYRDHTVVVVTPDDSDHSNINCYNSKISFPLKKIISSHRLSHPPHHTNCKHSLNSCDIPSTVHAMSAVRYTIT